MTNLEKCKWIYRNRYRIRNLIEDNFNPSLADEVIHYARDGNPEVINLSKKLLNYLPDSIYNLSDGPDIWLDYVKVVWSE